jgi:hypothetical protein
LEGSNAILKLVETLIETESVLKEINSSLKYQKIVGGNSWNQVPPYAESIVSIEYKKEEDINGIVCKMEEIVKKFDGDVKWIKIFNSPPQAHKKLKEFELFKSIAKEKFNIDIKSSQIHCSSDSRYFCDKGIPALVISPGEGDVDLTKYYQVLKSWVEIIGKVE